MLTKDEADRLYDALVELSLTRREIRERIATFTAKPKREIQVGDIYLDGNKIPIPISQIDPDGTYPLKSLYQRSYTEDGKYDVLFATNRGTNNKEDLDLSKRYKLVEIEE